MAVNPFLDGLVSAGGDYVVAGGDEADAADVVVVALQRLDALVGLKVPQFDGHVGRARDEQLPLGVEGDVLHRVRVALQRPLVVARLEIPYLHVRVRLPIAIQWFVSVSNCVTVFSDDSRSFFKLSEHSICIYKLQWELNK